LVTVVSLFKFSYLLRELNLVSPLPSTQWVILAAISVLNCPQETGSVLK